ncbi:MAG: chloride channel protein [Thermodesulfobacteriota bacterium]
MTDDRPRRPGVEEEDLPAGFAAWRETLLSLAAWRRHLVWAVAALLSGAGALLFNFADSYGEELIDRAHELSPWIPFAMVSLGMVLLCQLRDRFFPGTEGTGIPQAIAALKMREGPERAHVLSLRVAIGKMILLVLALALGPTIGREGPSVHVGACFMYLSRRFAGFPRHLVERGLILAGGAAGIAAAFNAPVAGVVFAFEEIGRSFEKANASVIVRTAIVACLVSIVALGDYLFYGRIEASLATLEEWLWVPAIGVAGGLAGGSFSQALVWLAPRYGRWYRARPLACALALGLGLGVLGLLSQGLSYGSGYPEAERILIGGEEVPWWFLPTHAAASFLTLVSAIPGGLFDPSLTTGAALGQLAAPWVAVLDRQETVLLFMVSFFCGVVQSPITSAVILVEMTAARFFTLPLLVASIVAYEASRLVCRTALYEALAEGFLARMRGTA